MRYDKYILNGKERVRLLGEFAVISLVVSYLFYDEIRLAILCIPICPVYLNYRKKELIAIRKRHLQDEFVDWIVAAAAVMNGGISPEKAFVSCLDEMERLHGRRGYIRSEIVQLKVKLSRGISFGEGLTDLGRRSGVEDIAEFSQVFMIAKEQSGQMQAVIEETAVQLQEKKEVEAEIETLLSGKKLEQRLMMVIPLGIVLYLKISAGAFMQVLYHNLYGIVIMSICLLAYILAFLYAERILKIRV